MKYTQIPTNTFKELQMNAGIITDGFTPATGQIGNIIGATTGGIAFADNMSFTDLGEDIDNCPKNMLELKQLESHEVTLSGTFVTVSAALAKSLAAVADTDQSDATHIVPRNDVLKGDFKDIWFIGDYSDVNTGDNAGFLAIHVLNALNTGGFQIQSSDKAKGQFAFTYTGHYSMEAQDTVPYEIYVKAGSEGPATPSITLDKQSVSIGIEETATVAATTVPAGETVTWTSADTDVATVAAGVITGVGAGTTTVTATITVEGQTYSAECAVTVAGA